MSTIVGEGTRGEHHWTVEFCGTLGWQVSSWKPHPELRWVQSFGRGGNGCTYALVRNLADLDALIEALTSAREKIAAREQVGR